MIRLNLGVLKRQRIHKAVEKPQLSYAFLHAHESLACMSSAECWLWARYMHGKQTSCEPEKPVCCLAILFTAFMQRGKG
jgi:hypothetical protein